MSPEEVPPEWDAEVDAAYFFALEQLPEGPEKEALCEQLKAETAFFCGLSEADDAPDPSPSKTSDLVVSQPQPQPEPTEPEPERPRFDPGCVCGNFGGTCPLWRFLRDEPLVPRT